MRGRRVALRPCAGGRRGVLRPCANGRCDSVEGQHRGLKDGLGQNSSHIWPISVGAAINNIVYPFAVGIVNRT